MAVLAVAGAGSSAYVYYTRAQLPEVQVEPIERRDLEALVSASGKIQPERLVNISSDTMGRVTQLAVDEGDRVDQGQFLMLIDPEAAQSAVEMGAASLGAARESLRTVHVAVETARANLDLSLRNVARTRDLARASLVSQETLDRAESEAAVRQSELDARETEVRVQEQRLQQETANLRSARNVLSKVTIDAPMAGVITRLNIEQGETVVVGTMNNAGTVLMTIADLSVIQAVLDVDETDILDVKLGQSTVVTIDALPDREFRGVVTKIGSSATQANAGQSGGAADQRGTTFEVEVTLSDDVPGMRPDFSCSADITTAVRSSVVSVPIQALTVRERDDVEVEGVFVFRDGRIEFVAVEVGIAGERYFEVLSGLAEGDDIVTGPYSAVRELEAGDEVRLEVDEDDE